MAKLTATEFGKLDPQAAYSAYDDAFAGVTEARAAQANALTDLEKHTAPLDPEDPTKGGIVAVKDRELADLKTAHADAVAALQAELKAAADTLTQTIADKDAERLATVDALTTTHAGAISELQLIIVARDARIGQLEVYDDVFKAEQKIRKIAEADAKIAAATAARLAAELEKAALAGTAVPIEVDFIEDHPPTDDIGKDGDKYTDTKSGLIYRKANGTWF